MPAGTRWLIPQEQCGGINNMAVTYPREPELMLRFGWTGTGMALEKDERMVKITVNRCLDWEGLVPAGATAPGFFQRYIGWGGDPYIKKVRSS